MRLLRKCGDFDNVETTAFSRGRNEKQIRKLQLKNRIWTLRLQDEKDNVSSVRDSRPWTEALTLKSTYTYIYVRTMLHICGQLTGQHVAERPHMDQSIHLKRRVSMLKD